jgi:hypothetical protein
MSSSWMRGLPDRFEFFPVVFEKGVFVFVAGIPPKAVRK